MHSCNDEINLISLTEQERRKLTEIIREFVLISDVFGVAMGKMDGSGVFCYEYKDVRPIQIIHDIYEFISNDPHLDIKNYNLGMFVQSLIEHNGHKILLASVRSEIVVMFILDKSAYIGLAMLVMEGFLREIDRILYDGIA